MEEDNLLMIPHLSKELNLIGFPPLPYNFRKAGKTKSKNKDHEGSLKVIFNSKLMIEALASVCFELVKQMKSVNSVSDDDVVDKLTFENIKLEKQLKMCKVEFEKKITEVAAARRENQLLQEKIDQLQKKIKDFQVEQQSAVKKTQTNENILKHAIKKKELDLFELHKAIWKQFNLANQNYFPENFEILLLNQPNFSKLWSEVKYSDVKTKEEALKEAVCIFQDNMKSLMEENFLLKTTFITILREFHEIFEFMVDKMGIPKSPLLRYKVKDFMNVEEFNISMYSNILYDHFKFIKKIGDLFEKYSFHVCDDLFVCWSNIIADLQDFALITNDTVKQKS